MKKLLWTAITSAALAGAIPAVADPLDEQAARLAAIERENAILRKENAALRERARLQDENARLREKLSDKTPSDPAPVPPNGSRRGWVQEPALLPPAAAAAIADPRIASAYMAVKAPIYKAPPPAAEGGTYVWIDGLGTQTNLPNVGLGLHLIGLDAGFFPDNGAAHDLRQRLRGGGLRGGIGYNLPGTNWRAEFGGAYLRADGSNSGSAAPTSGIGVLFVNGASSTAFFGCAGTFPPCATSAALSSDISAWQLNAKLAYDWRAGWLLLSPSVALFGGQNHAHQTLSETFSRSSMSFFIAQAGTYLSSTALSSTDFGARIGLDANLDVNSWLTLGVGGFVGLAGRTASLAGSDAASSTPLGIFNGASVISAGATGTAFVANAEVAALVRVTPFAAIRGFAGVNLDTRTVGVAGPSYAGSFGTAPGTPAGILFDRQASYYAGAGVVARFGPGPLYAKN